MTKCLTQYYRSDAMADKIITEVLHDGQVVRLTLNAPKANVLDAEMMTNLHDAFDGLKQNSDVKLIQFVGAGEHFCFGASVPEHTKEKAPQMLSQFHGLFFSLANLSIPTMAIVSGQCLGGGMELALMCNFLFADKSAKLGQPEINLGVFAPPASVILPLKIGQTRADELLVSGRIISIDEANQFGLITKSFDDQKSMLEGVKTWVGKNLLTKSASSLKFAVRAARIEFNRILRVQLVELERLYNDELMATNDANEGISSFLERRKPEWKNQ
jgi:cyclohexa-1,5-dienecarbonyl-CoA hydratase